MTAASLLVLLVAAQNPNPYVPAGPMVVDVRESSTQQPGGTFVQVKQPVPPEPPIGYIFELRFGFFTPRIGDEKGLTTNPYTEVFGNKSMFFGGAEFDIIAWHKYGALTVGFAAGYSEIYGQAVFQSSGAPSTEKTSLILWPLRLPISYRFDVTWSRWGVPLVPYVKLALLSTIWNATKGGSTEVVNGVSGNGVKWGWGGTLGVAFMLDVLSPSMAKDLRSDTGIRHTYIFGEYDYDQVTSFGKNGLNLSARYFVFGLGFEF